MDFIAAVLRDPRSSQEQLLRACEAIREMGPGAKSAVPALVGVLDKGVIVRTRALEAIASAGGEQALEKVNWGQYVGERYIGDAAEAMLKDHRTAKALGEAGMVKMLEDLHPEARARGARLLALSRTATPDAVYALLARLNDPAFDARHAASDALKSLRPRMDSAAIDAIVGRLDRERIRIAEADAAAKLPEKAEDPSKLAAHAVADDREAAEGIAAEKRATEERLAAEQAADHSWELPHPVGIPVGPGNPSRVEPVGPPARPALERVVSKDASERLDAVRELSRSDDAVFVKRLLTRVAASDADEAVRHEAYRLLTGREADEREARETLVGAAMTRIAKRAYQSFADSEGSRKIVCSVMDHLMADDDPETRRWATAWVARENPRGPATPYSFVALMAVGDVDDRRAATDALRVRHDPAWLMVDALVLAMHDSDPQVVGTAIEALGSYGPAAEPALDTLIQISAERSNAQRAEAAFTLLRLGPRGREAGLKYWIKAMSSRDVQEQEQAVRAVATIGVDAKPAVPGLVSMLAGASNDSRINVAQTLGAIGPAAKAAIPALTRMADNRHIDVRSAAVGALAKIDPEGQSLGPALVAAVLNKDRAACGVLAGPMKKAKAPPEIVRRLEGIALDDPDAGVRETARAAATELGGGT
ncbi:MAG TPA: HEAT repeat domain-containing protein [Tepidisphaeraceae bacterium]|nr:HEAT repeat domain-containing protein [Tepidisphaeraceae bacterium]